VKEFQDFTNIWPGFLPAKKGTPKTGAWSRCWQEGIQAFSRFGSPAVYHGLCWKDRGENDKPMEVMQRVIELNPGICSKP